MVKRRIGITAGMALIAVLMLGCNLPQPEVESAKTVAAGGVEVDSFRGNGTIAAKWRGDVNADEYVLMRARDEVSGVREYEEVYRGRVTNYIDSKIAVDIRYIYRLDKVRKGVVHPGEETGLGVGHRGEIDMNEPNDRQEEATALSSFKRATIYYYRFSDGRELTEVDWYKVKIGGGRTEYIQIKEDGIVGMTTLKLKLPGQEAIVAEQGKWYELKNEAGVEKELYIIVSPDAESFVEAGMSGGMIRGYTIIRSDYMEEETEEETNNGSGGGTTDGSDGGDTTGGSDGGGTTDGSDGGDTTGGSDGGGTTGGSDDGSGTTGGSDDGGGTTGGSDGGGTTGGSDGSGTAGGSDGGGTAGGSDGGGTTGGSDGGGTTGGSDGGGGTTGGSDGGGTAGGSDGGDTTGGSDGGGTTGGSDGGSDGGDTTGGSGDGGTTGGSDGGDTTGGSDGGGTTGGSGDGGTTGGSDGGDTTGGSGDGGTTGGSDGGGEGDDFPDDPGDFIEEKSDLFVNDGTGRLLFFLNDQQYANKGYTFWRYLESNWEAEQGMSMELVKESGNYLGGYGFFFAGGQIDGYGECMLILLIQKDGNFAVGKAVDGRYESIAGWKGNDYLRKGYGVKNTVGVRQNIDNNEYIVSINGLDAYRFIDEDEPVCAGNRTGAAAVVTSAEEFPQTAVKVWYRER